MQRAEYRKLQEKFSKMFFDFEFDKLKTALKTYEVQKFLCFSIFILATVGLLIIYDHIRMSDDPKLKYLEEIVASAPVYPDFRETLSSKSSKSFSALISKTYVSSVEPDAVKTFYIIELTKNGWTLSKEEKVQDWFVNYGGKEITFTKDEYLIAIEYAGKGNAGWDYAASFEWQKH